MPIYEYACTSCAHRTDILHGLNDPGPTFCPSCGKEGTMRKLFAPPTIHFRGSGWAKKDRASSSGSKAAGGSKADGGEGGAPKTDGVPSGDTGTSTSDAASSSSSAAGKSSSSDSGKASSPDTSRTSSGPSNSGD